MTHNKVSLSSENFLKAVYRYESRNKKGASISDLASRLNISKSAATDMAKKLSTNKLVKYEKYSPLKLSTQGKKQAMQVIRKHRLWETFLHEVLDMDLFEVHREAEALEHSTSESLADKLAAFLNYPKFDPHGDPIPDKSGNLPKHRNSVPLSEIKTPSILKIIRLDSFSESFFNFCKQNNIRKGISFKLEQIFPNEDMFEIEISDKKIVLNKAICKQIIVTKNS